MDDRYSEWIVLNTPGGWVGHSKFDTDPLKHYPIVQGDFAATFQALYPKRPNFNQYTECSSRGTCDYATGECKCFDGFEGRGCRRTTCPNSCSGHGRCLDNYDINPTQYMSFNYPTTRCGTRSAPSNARAIADTPDTTATLASALLATIPPVTVVRTLPETCSLLSQEVRPPQRSTSP